MLYLKEGDIFLHAKHYDSDDHPLRCKIVSIENGMITWIRADMSWAHFTQTFFIDDAERNVLRIL